MTPRIKEELNESDFLAISQRLFSQTSLAELSYNLSDESGLFSILHPSILKISYLYENHPSALNFLPHSHGRYLISFRTRLDAQNKFPGLRVYGGFPKDIFTLLKDDPEECLIDFDTLGTVHFSKTQQSSSETKGLQLHDYVLPCWLDYALSPELWGPNGKWTRFHERLHTLFTNNGLFIKQDSPGYYPLHKNCDWLIQEGFLGKKTNESFELILGWDFPLSGLIKLEKIFEQEL
jgi:hypothetical protein